MIAKIMIYLSLEESPQTKSMESSKISKLSEIYKHQNLLLEKTNIDFQAFNLVGNLKYLKDSIVNTNSVHFELALFKSAEL